MEDVQIAFSASRAFRPKAFSEVTTPAPFAPENRTSQIKEVG